jgi:hypothetical protein
MSNPSESAHLITPADQHKTIDLTPSPDKVKELSLSDQIMLQYNLASLKDLDPETQAQIKNITEILALDSQIDKVSKSENPIGTITSSSQYFDFDRNGVLCRTTHLCNAERQVKNDILTQKKNELVNASNNQKNKPVLESNRITGIYKEAELKRKECIEGIFDKINLIESDSKETKNEMKLIHADKLSQLINSVSETQIWNLNPEEFDHQIRLIHAILELNVINLYTDNQKVYRRESGKLYLKNLENVNILLSSDLVSLMQTDSLEGLESTLKEITTYLRNESPFDDDKQVYKKFIGLRALLQHKNMVISNLSNIDGEDKEEEESDPEFLKDSQESVKTQFALSLINNKSAISTLKTISAAGVQANFIQDTNKDVVDLSSSVNRKTIINRLTPLMIQNLTNNGEYLSDLRDLEISALTKKLNQETEKSRPALQDSIQFLKSLQSENQEIILSREYSRPFLILNNKFEITPAGIENLKQSIDAYEQASIPKGWALFKSVDEAAVSSAQTKISESIKVLNQEIAAWNLNIQTGFEPRSYDPSFMENIKTLATFCRDKNLGTVQAINTSKPNKDNQKYFETLYDQDIVPKDYYTDRKKLHPINHILRDINAKLQSFDDRLASETEAIKSRYDLQLNQIGQQRSNLRVQINSPE